MSPWSSEWPPQEDQKEPADREQVLREIATIEAKLNAIGEPQNSHQETVRRVFSALLQYRMRVLGQVDGASRL
jgi:hypothetical protein